MQNKVSLLCDSIRGQFRSRNKDFGVNFNIEVKNSQIWLIFSKEDSVYTVTMPIPYVKNGVVLISNNGVERALSNHFIEEEQRELDYFGLMHRIICGDTTGLIPEFLVKKGPYINQIARAFRFDYVSTVIYNMQRAINEIVNKMPLHETDLTSFVMNQRLIIVDPSFDTIRDPGDRLEYQIEKNKKYFGYGWTSMGLSDGVLADKNYILKDDIRKLTPFGLRHHNPQRNLYSTLPMKGDEDPLVRSQSMQNMMDNGVGRKGWNWLTAFVDIPDVFEDQIMVDKSHKNKSITYTKRIQCFGKVLVQKGDLLKWKHPLSVAKDGEVKTFNTVADRAVVEDVIEAQMNIGGVPTKTHNVMVKYQRKLKDGTKITNLHGNKGVIRLKDLGYAIDPKTGEERKIDVIVSCQSIKKRKNFGQILEALMNVAYGEDKVKVIGDKAKTSVEKIEKRLLSSGYPEDGCWMCHTYAGKFSVICGKVFWGVTKDVEDQIWDYGDTIRRNGRELRTAGLKFSTVEFRALMTRFGKSNSIIDEILSYVQGTDDLHEQIKILRSKKGELPDSTPVVNVRNVKPLTQSSGTMFSKGEIEGSVVDEGFCPDGFILELPLPYQVSIDKNHNAVEEGVPRENYSDEIVRKFTFDKIYIPSANLRKCWRHDAGKYGMSEMGILVNNIVKSCHRHMADPESSTDIWLFYLSISNYFGKVAAKMGTKRGEISTYGMAVRHPFSAKGVATLSNSLPKNTIEIHKSMAKNLNVVNGDVVLVERFPCLGFMSVRPQKVKITNDPMCRYTIRVSGNNLVSMSLDFDGDVLFIAAFHTKEAKETLRKEWTNPNKTCYDVIKELNKKSGAPHFKQMGLRDYEIMTFEDLTKDEHATLVKRATGVKSHTGPVIALAYNIMRILENSEIRDNQKTNVAVEVFLDKVGNSVFKQKHGVKSLHDIVIDAICSTDVEALVEHGFNRNTSNIICNIIRKKALELGVKNPASYHKWALANGRSKLINRIVRQQNKIYFASRAQLEGCALIHHLESPVVDWPSKMLKTVLSGKAKETKTVLDEYLDQKYGIGSIKDVGIQEACKSLWKCVKGLMSDNQIKPVNEIYRMLENTRRNLSQCWSYL